MNHLSLNTRAERMHALLTHKLTPIHISLIDESAQHHGHKGIEEFKNQLNQKQDTQTNSNGNLLETHFALEISATLLNDLSRVKQHQLIYDIVAEEFKTGLHSLKIKVIKNIPSF